VAALSDRDLQTLLQRDAGSGWQAFVEQHTATLLALIARAGVRDRDETMDVYTLLCEHLAADNCARLRRWDASRGSLGAWLAVVTRRVFVDWVRSRAGRRRLFGVIEALDPLHQQVFQLYYWHDRTPSEIAGELSAARGRHVGVEEVLTALDAIHDVLTERHYGELVSMTARSRPPVSLEEQLESGRADPPADEAAPDISVERRERDAAIESAIASLPSEDAAILRLHYWQGLSLAEVRQALHLSELTRARLGAIVSRLRAQLEPA
jgi:DNA-directed RNA polymerase specialized sigma24 family protein